MSLTSSVSYPLCAKHLFANSHAHPLFSLSDRLYLLILPSSPIKQTDLPLVSKFPSDMKKSNEKGRWERGRHRLRSLASRRRRPRRTLTNPRELLVPSLSSCQKCMGLLVWSLDVYVLTNETNESQKNRLSQKVKKIG
ncbi:PREDICTED: uncharacterized protein LOC106331477 isoform X4 [Brassica oleracea var. oleracea]|uniref:uncharacterized protein LOC106331477 isoform X4 n=1 Tax=Brassica oleracea var. oleracea TaxID=109376 RepID=UPI0006A74806|nr:PREDICTED: uncharacterized protein LOC106331477 isoform X4 [Brassica oleracea var. oleracea]